MEEKTEQKPDQIRFSIFRKKSLQKASGPEELDKYLKVTSVGAWIVVITGALVVMIIFFWASLSKLDVTVSGAGKCKDGVLTCYFRVNEIKDIKVGTNVKVAGQDYTVSKINPEYFLAEDLPREVLFLSLKSDWYQTALVQCDLEDGIYPVYAQLEARSPISFLTGGDS